MEGAGSLVLVCETTNLQERVTSSDASYEGRALPCSLPDRLPSQAHPSCRKLEQPCLMLKTYQVFLVSCCSSTVLVVKHLRCLQKLGIRRTAAFLLPDLCSPIWPFLLR